MIISEDKRTQLFSYIVHAGEILKKNKQIPQRSYKYALLPSGPELYTGIIKSAGHLFLDKNISHRILITQQNSEPKKIISYGENLTLRGREIKNKEILPKQSHKISDEIKEQLLYTRLLTQISEVNIRGIGTEVPLSKIIKQIKEHTNEQTGIICIGSFPQKIDTKEQKILIEQLLMKEVSDQNWIGDIFCEITKEKNCNPELIMYGDTSEIKRKNTNGTGYLCVVA